MQETESAYESELKLPPSSFTILIQPQDAEDRSVSVLIQQSLLPAVRLELFPKSTIDVFLFVIENDGIEGCVASGTMAASTALAHARIDMLGLVASSSAVSSSLLMINVTSFFIQAVLGKELWMDPTTSEAKAATGCVTMACMPALGLTTNLWQSGRMSIDEAEKVRGVISVYKRGLTSLSVWTRAKPIVNKCMP